MGLIGSVLVWSKHKNYSTQTVCVDLGQFEGDPHPLTSLDNKVSWNSLNSKKIYFFTFKIRGSITLSIVTLIPVTQINCY